MAGNAARDATGTAVTWLTVSASTQPSSVRPGPERLQHSVTAIGNHQPAITADLDASWLLGPGQLESQMESLSAVTFT
jgi:hypothetical protein